MFKKLSSAIGLTGLISNFNTPPTPPEEKKDKEADPDSFGKVNNFSAVYGKPTADLPDAGADKEELYTDPALAALALYYAGLGNPEPTTPAEMVDYLLIESNAGQLTEEQIMKGITIIGKPNKTASFIGYKKDHSKSDKVAFKDLGYMIFETGGDASACYIFVNPIKAYKKMQRLLAERYVQLTRDFMMSGWNRLQKDAEEARRAKTAEEQPVAAV